MDQHPIIHDHDHSHDHHHDHHHHSHSHSGLSSQTRRAFLTAAISAAALPLWPKLGDSALASATAQLNQSLGRFGKARDESELLKAFRARAAEMPIFDTHEHLWHEETRLKRPVDFFMLFSHYTSDDLIAAGMAPQDCRDLQNAEIPLDVRWKKLAPFWPLTRTTGYGRCILIAARDLFGVEDLNEKSVRSLSEKIANANRIGWYQEVLKQRARIELSILDDVTTNQGQPLRPDTRFFKIVTRFDYIVTAQTRKDLDHIEAVTGTSVHSLKNLTVALERAFDRAVAQGLAGIKSGLAYSRTLRYEPVTESEAEQAFSRVFANAPAGTASEMDTKRLQDYLMHQVIRQAAERRLPVQIHTGYQAGNRNTITNTNPAYLNQLIMAYPQARFDLFHGGYPYCSELATLAKNFPNVYADLCWLHIISPGVTRRVLHEWIETIPAHKILGFGGDFFHVEGVYGHAQMARAVTADVLAEKVEDGYLKEEEAVELMKRILYSNGKALFSGAGV